MASIEQGFATQDDERMSEASFAAAQSRLYGDLDIADPEETKQLRVAIEALESQYPEYGQSVDIK